MRLRRRRISRGCGFQSGAGIGKIQMVRGPQTRSWPRRHGWVVARVGLRAEEITTGVVFSRWSVHWFVAQALVNEGGTALDQGVSSYDDVTV